MGTKKTCGRIGHLYRNSHSVSNRRIHPVEEIYVLWTISFALRGYVSALRGYIGFGNVGRCEMRGSLLSEATCPVS